MGFLYFAMMDCLGYGQVQVKFLSLFNEGVGLMSFLTWATSNYPVQVYVIRKQTNCNHLRVFVLTLLIYVCINKHAFFSFRLLGWYPR